MAREPVAPGALKVLVVDDHRMVLISTRLILESDGFRVVVCERGAEVLETARRELPDVILLDIMMPGVDGWETLSRLRDDAETKDIPVVVFTAREHQRAQRLARELGAVGYVQKPYDGSRLSALLREHATRRRAAAPMITEAIAPAAPPQSS